MSSFTQLGSTFDGAARLDQLGYRVSLSSDGTTLAIGLPFYLSGGGLGKTQIYSWNGTAWVQRGSDLNNESGSDTPSWISLSDDGNTVAIGSWNNENQTGHTRIYAWNGSAWVQRGSDIDGDAPHS